MPRYNSCCEPEEDLVVDCPCEQSIPTSLPTVNLSFDIQSGDNNVEVSNTISFVCCEGDNSIAFVNNENVPTYLTIGVPVVETFDRSYRFTIDFVASSAVAEEGSFTMNYLICGETIPLIVNYTITDSCEDEYPTASPAIIEVEFDIYTDDGETSTHVITPSPLECCGMVESIALQRISGFPAGCGISFIGLPIGTSTTGGTYPLTFSFDADVATPSYGVIYVNADFLLCGRYPYRQRFEFTVINSCVAAYPSSVPTAKTIEIDRYTTSTGNYNDEVNFSAAYTPCGVAQIEVLSIAPSVLPTNTGVVLTSPAVGDVILSEIVPLAYFFRQPPSVDGATGSVNLKLRFDGSFVVNQVVTFGITSSCVVSVPGDQAEDSNSYSIVTDGITNDFVTVTGLSFDCCGGDPYITIVGVTDGSDAGTGLSILNVGQVFTGTSYTVHFQWNPEFATPSSNDIVDVDVMVCGDIFVQPIRVIVAAVPACMLVSRNGGFSESGTYLERIGTETGSVDVDWTVTSSVSYYFQVIYNGVIVGVASGTGSSSGTITFTKSVAVSTMVRVVVEVTGGSATWTFDINCPV